MICKFMYWTLRLLSSICPQPDTRALSTFMASLYEAVEEDIEREEKR